MKNKILLLLTLSLLTVSPVLAQGRSQDNPGLSNREEAQVNQKRSEKVSELGSRLISKLEHRADKYEEFFGKLERRRAMLQEKGADLTDFDSMMRVAEVNLTNVRAEISETENLLNELDLSEGIRPFLQSLLAEVSDVRADFRVLHQSVVDLVEELGRLSELLEVEQE